MSGYRVIDGLRYDADLLAAAESFTRGRGESAISLPEMQQLHRRALDGRGITEVERRTLRRITEQHRLTAPARQWYQSQLPGGDSGTVSRILERVAREYRVPRLVFEVDAAEVGRQEALPGGTRLLEAAVRAALDALLRIGQGVLSLQGVVSRYDLTYNGNPRPEDVVRRYLDGATLVLLPAAPDAPAAREFEVPAGVEAANFWCFGLRAPTFHELRFVAAVHRAQNLQYSRGHFAGGLPLDQLIPAAIRRYGHFNRLAWRIDPAEVSRQLALLPRQNFGNALFSAVHSAIFNGESSASLRDFVGQEVWLDPEVDLGEHIRDYANGGTLHLLPLDPRPGGGRGTAAFPVPESVSYSQESDWIFGLEMPKRTHVRAIVNTPRERNDGDTGWNDCFVDDTLPWPERLRRVVQDEQRLGGLQVTMVEADVKAQRDKYGPDWRYPAGLLRQAIDTVLHDHLTPQSPWQVAAHHLRDEVRADHHDDVREYRTGVSAHLSTYLQRGVLTFLAIDDAGQWREDGNPVKGETAEAFFAFHLLLPALSPVGFYILIPRRPDDRDRPYAYHAG